MKLHLNMATVLGLPGFSLVWDRYATHQRIADAGFDGVQLVAPFLGSAAICRDVGLEVSASGTYGKLPMDRGLVAAARKWKDEGAVCATLIVGTGLEDDDDVDVLVDGVLEASTRTRLPLYVETHRASITQDIWRTLRMVERFPEIEFNGDFSHWFTGHALGRSDFGRVLDALQPVLRRVRFLHGRVGTDRRIQACSTDVPAVTEQYLALWRQCDQVEIFAPELLPSLHGYAEMSRTDGEWEEQWDRWDEALALARFARRGFHA